jgi:hypothetical protein
MSCKQVNLAAAAISVRQPLAQNRILMTNMAIDQKWRITTSPLFKPLALVALASVLRGV